RSPTTPDRDFNPAAIAAARPVMVRSWVRKRLRTAAAGNTSAGPGLAKPLAGGDDDRDRAEVDGACFVELFGLGGGLHGGRGPCLGGQRRLRGGGRLLLRRGEREGQARSPRRGAARVDRAALAGAALRDDGQPRRRGADRGA